MHPTPYSTRTDNDAAQRLFQRHGFTPLGRVHGYYEDGTDAIKFQRSLRDGNRAVNDVALKAPFEGILKWRA